MFENPKDWYLVAAGIWFLIIFLPLLTKYSKNKFWCEKMQWHIKPNEIGNAGASNCGTCPRCQKRVLQDSQGNWFSASIQ